MVPKSFKGSVGTFQGDLDPMGMKFYVGVDGGGVGSVFESRFVSTAFDKELRARWSSSVATTPVLRPSVGAALLAMRADGASSSPGLLASLKEASEEVSRRLGSKVVRKVAKHG